MRIFCDTNVLISAFTTRGLCADLVRVVLRDHVLITSEDVLDELQRVLRQKFEMPESLVNDATGLLRESPVQPPPADLPSIDIGDETDRRILGSAIESGANVLVTGDNDFLEVADEIAAISILSPRELWSRLSSPRS